MSNNDGFGPGIFVGIFVGLIFGFCFCAILIAITGARYSDGYDAAYRDLKASKIEQVMKDRSPRLWLQLNPELVPKEK